MIKPFRIGVLVLSFVALIAFVTQDLSILVKYAGIVGLVCMGWAAILSGVLLRGGEIRANYATESNEDREKRFRWANNFFIIGLPNIIAAVVVYILVLARLAEIAAY
ncbi:DUF5316 domain-containing protein [Peptococcaceae bacterium 1198_IL3148]